MTRTTVAEPQRVAETPQSYTPSRQPVRATPARIGQHPRIITVTNADRAGILSTEYFHDVLTAEEQAQLGQTGMLPPTVLAGACARLRTELQALSAFLPAPIVHEQFIDPLPGRVRGAIWQGSLLFADLSGFTALSAAFATLGKQGAEEISSIITRLFSALTDELHTHHGALLKFGGDAITAFFPASELGALHPQRASQAALAMQQRMQAFAALRTRAGSFSLRLRIGVHSGQVFAAQVGDASHVELVVSGRNVNRVALAQEIAEPGEVVISEDTATHLAQAALEPRQAGFSRLHQLDAPPPPAPAPAPSWTSGRDDLAELEGLAQRIAALRPYLPYGLPRRFLEPDEGALESGEFRPVTVLFANFFPFSQALELLGDDVETAVQVLNAYYRRAQEVIHRYGGIVNKVDLATYGDKLMALFGAPSAHEDDPERAVRAALALQAACDAANQEIAELLKAAGISDTTLSGRQPVFDGLRQRIGLNTGVVFAGRVGSAYRHEYTVMGQHVNLAARLMAAADVGAVILSPATRKAVEHQIAVRELPAVALKGITEPVPLAQALYAHEVTQSVRRDLGHATLVGREEEFQTLLSEARAALHGRGRVLALLGEAGAGKSRLIADALHTLVLRSLDPAADLPPFLPFSVECQSYEQSTPYALIRELLRQFFSGHDTLDALTRRVNALVPELVRFAPLLGDLLGTPFQDTPLTAALTPQQRHDRAQELVEALVLAQAQRQPLLLICDDLHWADASSLELLGRLARQARHAALLLILSYRADPPIPEPWTALAHCTRLLIGELTPSDTAALVAALLQDVPPPELLTLVEKTQGNPFFVEEVIHSLIEAGVLARNGNGWRLTRPVEETLVPDSIEGVITARLDRLEERSREVLQVAAVVGRRFAYPVLAGIVNQRDTLLDLLGQLSEADLILAEQIERNLAYLFKQALTRDVAYEAILYARRRELHRRVVHRIEELHAARLDEQLALLAHHALQAEDWPRAFAFHLRAGRLAQARYANHEAIALYQRALLIAPQLESSPESRELCIGSRPGGQPGIGAQIVELYERLGWVYALVGEYDTALERYGAALDLLIAQADTPSGDLVRLHHHIAQVYEKRAAFDTAFEWLERGIDQADHNDVELARCYLLGAGIYQRQGRYTEAIEWAERGLAVAEQQRQLRDMAHAYYLTCGIYKRLGQHRAAVEVGQKSLALYEELGDLAGQADAHNNLANVFTEIGQWQAAVAHCQAALEFKEKVGDVHGVAVLTNNLGDLMRQMGEFDRAMRHFRVALGQFEALGSQYAIAVLNMNIGSVSLSQNNLPQARQHLDRSRQLFEEIGSEEFSPSSTATTPS